jgi:hypothetical protein
MEKIMFAVEAKFRELFRPCSIFVTRQSKKLVHLIACPMSYASLPKACMWNLPACTLTHGGLWPVL